VDPLVGGRFSQAVRRIQQGHQSNPKLVDLGETNITQDLLHGILVDPWAALAVMRAGERDGDSKESAPKMAAAGLEEPVVQNIEPESADPSWLVKQLEKLAGQYFSTDLFTWSCPAGERSEPGTAWRDLTRSSRS
jgi:hypothetical protein